MKSQFGGIWPALLTPMTAEGRPALDVVEQLTDLFARQGLDGLYVTGSTGQWPLLTREERCATVESVVKTAAGRLPVMVHVGAAATPEAVALARHANQAGADAISAVAPTYYAHSADAAFDHYRQIGQAGELPLYVYHLSHAGKMPLRPAEFVDRLLTVPNIAGMKYTDGDLYTLGLLHGRAAGRLQLFSGADEVMCQAVLSGAIGAIGTFYNLWGPVCQRVRQAMVHGNVDLGRAFMLRFQEAVDRILSSGSSWTFLRAAMRLKYNIDIGLPRAPLGVSDKPWKDADVERIIQLVDGVE